MSNILAVDDDASVLQLVAMILKQNDHTVLCASGGVEALMVFSTYRSKVDLVLTDVLMPGMTGIELVQRIRALDPSVGTLLMSGFTPDNLEVPGDVRLLKKPFAPRELIEVVEQVLAATRRAY